MSSSAVQPAGEIHTPLGKKPYVTPRALELSEIPGLIQTYVAATERAKAAGFDGVEVHAANGYLLDQFLRDGVNQRQDAYGGSLENRSRLVLEVVDAVVKAWRANRVGVRLSPLNTFNDITDSNPIATFTYAAEKLNDFGLAYLHVMEPIVREHMMYAEGEPVVPHIRKVFKGPLMLNGGYDAVTGAEAIASGAADFISYGIPFIANPDLPERYSQGLPLNQPDFDTFYTHEAKGYTDYPFAAQVST